MHLYKLVRFCLVQQVDKNSWAGSDVSALSKATAESRLCPSQFLHPATTARARALSTEDMHGSFSPALPDSSYHIGPCAFLITCTETHSAFLSLCVLHACVFFSTEHPFEISKVCRFKAHLLLHFCLWQVSTYIFKLKQLS